jgi:hypothetical protein
MQTLQQSKQLYPTFCAALEKKIKRDGAARLHRRRRKKQGMLDKSSIPCE